MKHTAEHKAADDKRPQDNANKGGCRANNFDKLTTVSEISGIQAISIANGTI